MTMREVYVLMRDVGKYADRDTSPVLAETRGEEACCHEYAHALLEEAIAALTQALEEGS